MQTRIETKDLQLGNFILILFRPNILPISLNKNLIVFCIANTPSNDTLFIRYVSSILKYYNFIYIILHFIETSFSPIKE